MMKQIAIIAAGVAAGMTAVEAVHVVIGAGAALILKKKMEATFKETTNA